MDPLSITTGALTLAGVVLKSSITARDCIGQLEDAPQTVADVADEIQTMRAALREVEIVIKQDPDAIERFGLQDVFGIAIKGCHATMMCIRKEYEHLFSRRDWKARIVVLWKEHEMAALLGRLDRKKASIAILVQTLTLYASFFHCGGVSC